MKGCWQWCGLLLFAFVAGMAGAWVQDRILRTQPATPVLVSLDVAALLADMARAAALQGGSADAGAERLVQVLQAELQHLTARRVIVLNAAAVVAGAEDLTPVLWARLQAAGERQDRLDD